MLDFLISNLVAIASATLLGLEIKFGFQKLIFNAM